jgi:iron(III) transport system permease protein
MGTQSKAWTILGATLIVLLVAVPLIGLGLAVVDRPADPLTGLSPTLSELIDAAGIWMLLARSILLSIAVSIGAVLIGGWLAWVEHRTKAPRWWVVLTLLPLAMPSYLVAATVRSALSPGGWIGATLHTPHMTGFAMATVVLTVITAPLCQLIIGSALQRSSAAEEEAARCLGASPAQVFRDVTLPRLRPAIGFSALIALLYTISDFGAVAVLDVPVLTWRLYLAVESQDIAQATVLGAATLLALLPLFAAARWLRGGTIDPGAANIRPVKPTALSLPARLLSGMVLTLVVGVGVAIPISTLALWVGDGLARGLSFVNPLGALTDTFLMATVGAILTTLLAALPAWTVAERHRRGKKSGWMEDGVYLTSALPGILLALGLILAALRLTAHMPTGSYGVLLGSGVLLLLGYSTRFVAEVFAPLRVAFSGLDPRQIESAAVLGAGPIKRLRTVILPAVSPGVVVGLLIGFNAIVKELPVTLLLGGATGLKTLSFRVWDRYNESLWHDAGVAGLLLVGLALASAVLTTRWRRND